MEGQNNQEEQLNHGTEPAIDTTIPNTTNETSTLEKSPLYQEKIDLYLANLRKEENLLLGLLLGFAAALVGAVLWAVITLATNYQIGFMAVGVGLLVGFAVRIGGKGLSPVFSVSGAILALLGCVLGNLFTIYGSAANELGLSVFEIMALVDVPMAFSILKESAQPMDFLFYAIAIYEGYRFSTRVVTDEELAQAGNA